MAPALFISRNARRVVAETRDRGSRAGIRVGCDETDRAHHLGDSQRNRGNFREWHLAVALETANPQRRQT